MAWCRPGHKPLSELMMVSLLVHINVTQPLWVNIPGFQESWGGCCLCNILLCTQPIAVLIWYPAHDDLEIAHLTLVAITVITVWVPYYIIQVTAIHLKISSQYTGFDIWKNFHLPNFQNLAFFNTHNIWFWRKFCPNPHPLAQLAVLLSPDRQAEGYVESWNKLFLMPVLQMCCSDSD